MTQSRRDAAELSLLRDVVDALEYGMPAATARLREYGASIPDFALVLDNPFGIDGPAVLDLGDMRALLFNHMMIQSSMRVSDPGRLILPYTQVMMGFLLFCSDPRRIEMIGLGGGSLAKYCYHRLPGADITVVEIDPRVIALRDRFGIPRDDKRFRIICAHGADFVHDGPSRPDVILVDGFNSLGQVSSLCSAGFYENCRDRLSDDGIFVVNLCDNVLANRTAKTHLRRAFGGQVGMVSIKRHQNRVIFASKDLAFPPDSDQLISVAINLGGDHEIDFTKLAKRIRATG